MPDNNHIAEEMEKLKNVIDQAKENMAKSEGRLQSVMERLTKDFSLSSLEETEKEALKLKEELTALDQEIEKDYIKLRKDYDW